MKRTAVFSHPPGLYVLFFTEMWERFSFYGMRSLLVLYMTEHLLVQVQQGKTVLGFSSLQTWLESLFGSMSPQALSSQIYGLYTGLVYFTPFFGGLLADRVLGQRRTVLLGGVLMAAGHFAMAYESLFLPALLLLILGNGCFKPNISTQVGSLYPDDDGRRDSAFTLFYMGINLGAFLAPLVCGTLGQFYGWHYGFGAAGVGMLLGLLIYGYGQKYLPQDHLENRVLFESAPEPLTLGEWRIIAALVLLAVVNIVFWAVFEQQGNTLQLFAEHDADREIFGWEIPSTWFQSINPVLIIVLSPLIAGMTARAAASGIVPSGITKMATGAVLLGASYLVLMFVTTGGDGATKTGLHWLVLCNFIYTLGEILMSPVGLSLVSRVAPRHLTGMLMGMWFMSSFFGNYLSGYIGSFYGLMPRPEFFLLLAALGMSVGLAIFLLKKPLEKALGRS